MATLQKIRTQGGLLVAIVIGLALVAFILGDLFQSGTSMFTPGRLEVGIIKGESVQYPEYQNKIEQLAEIYRSNTGVSQLDDETWFQVREQTWEGMIREKVMGDVYASTGVQVSAEEMLDMIQGNNIHPIVLQIFSNPNTGEFDRSAVVNFVRNLEFGVAPEQRNYWLYLEQQILSERLQTKYSNLISKALYVPSKEAERHFQFTNRNASIEYIALQHSSVADSEIEITDRDLRDYYSKNSDLYKVDKNRTIEYVAFEVTPTQADFAAAERWINEIKPEFEATEENIQFVNSNSDVSFTDLWYKQDNLDSNLAEWIFGEGATLNEVFGPYFEDNAYKLVKLHADQMMPDSVQARHILLPVTTMEEMVAAQTLADSLKTIIERGADFGSLARLYSTDSGSAIAGGDLGWFGRGMMVKPFEDAAFGNSVNEVSIVPTQFGLHIVQTTRRGGLSRQVQVAVLERIVTPSTQTYQSVYARASRFASENTSRDKFNAAIEAESLTKRQATLRENDRFIAGLETPRGLIRAAFEAKVNGVLRNNDNSPIFELGDNFVVAVLASVVEEGTAPFESVRTSIELAVEKEKKADVLVKRMQTAAAGKTDLYSVASALAASVNIATDVNFGSSVISGIGTEPAVVGAASVLANNAISAPVKGNNGVYMVRVTSASEIPGNSVELEKQRLLQNMAFRANFEAYQSQREAVEIVDKRSRFY